MASPKNLNEYIRQYAPPGKLDPLYDYEGAYKSGFIPTRWMDIPVQDKIEDITQMLSGQRSFFNPLKMYMWSDKFKKPGYGDRSGYVAPK